MWWRTVFATPITYTHTNCCCVVSCLCLEEMYSVLPVLPEWICICDGEWWCYMPPFRHPCGPRAGHVFTRQHNLWYNVCGILQVRSPPARWLWWFQLQCLGLHEDRTCRCAFFMRKIEKFWKTTAYLLLTYPSSSDNKWRESVWEWRFLYSLKSCV